MGKADNTFLESSKIFDVTHVTAVVTGGGSGIGLMMTQVNNMAPSQNSSCSVF